MSSSSRNASSVRRELRKRSRSSAVNGICKWYLRPVTVPGWSHLVAGDLVRLVRRLELRDLVWAELDGQSAESVFQLF